MTRVAEDTCLSRHREVHDTGGYVNGFCRGLARRAWFGAVKTLCCVKMLHVVFVPITEAY